MLSKIKKFFKEVKVETRHINWLSRKEVIKYTLIVVFLSLAMAIFLGFFDFIFNYFLSRLILL